MDYPNRGVVLKEICSKMTEILERNNNNRSTQWK